MPRLFSWQSASGKGFTNNLMKTVHQSFTEKLSKVILSLATCPWTCYLTVQKTQKENPCVPYLKIHCLLPDSPAWVANDNLKLPCRWGFFMAACPGTGPAWGDVFTSSCGEREEINCCPDLGWGWHPSSLSSVRPVARQLPTPSLLTLAPETNTGTRTQLPYLRIQYFGKLMMSLKGRISLITQAYTWVRWARQTRVWVDLKSQKTQAFIVSSLAGLSAWHGRCIHSLEANGQSCKLTHLWNILMWLQNA